MTTIRTGTRTDVPAAFGLIKELAMYEKQPDQVLTTVEQMETDGFGPTPLYGFFVAEVDGEIVGISLYYDRYSTWKGRRLWLEDIIVTESQRGRGIGQMLLDRTIEKARELNCTGMMWQVLDWNEPSIEFYKKKYNAEIDGEWLNCHLDFD